MINFEVHRAVFEFDQSAAVVARVLVAVFDALRLPVREINFVFPHGDGENVVEVQAWIAFSVRDNFSVFAVQVAHGNEIFARVTEKQLVGLEGNCERVWPAEISGDDEL